MLKERREVAQTVAEQLFAAEAAIDAAIAATAALTAAMVTARQTINIGACIGQDSLTHAAKTCAELVQARGSIVASHAALAVAQKQIGLGAVNFGGWVDKAGVGPSEEGRQTGQLRAVPSARAA